MYKSVSFSSFGSAEIDIDTWRSKIELPVFSQDVEYPPRRKVMSYNRTYPLTRPIVTLRGLSFKIGIITDMDTESKCANQSNKWKSLLRYGSLRFNNHTRSVSVEWEQNDSNAIEIKSSYSNGGRGMEMSELVVFNAKVYAVDDRTGIVYEIIENRVAPWVILSDGDGTKSKGLKGEWMAVKDQQLYVGGNGKDWSTTDGIMLHRDPQWIKIIEKDGAVKHLNWVDNYQAMQRKAGYDAPGYIIHESAVWSEIHKSWFFLPRRASLLRYNDRLDEVHGANILFQCSEDFRSIRVITIGEIIYPERGFSSFRFIPGTRDQFLVALKTVELHGETQSYITSFTIDGTIVLPDTKISGQYKYEGIEFL
uniref:Soluble calcium-activated nucleotidase 1 n=1 Tax=Ciona savignyi TaxID=51511 RepID=H2ZQ57_CIOSA